MPQGPYFAPDDGVIRAPLLRAIQLRQHVVQGLRALYLTQGVSELRAPLLVRATGACENVDTLLSVIAATDCNISTNRFRGFLSQTGQLALENALTAVPACWCHTVSFRDDRPDIRHLREFELVEEEFTAQSAWLAARPPETPLALFTALLDRIQEVVRTAISPFADSDVANRLSLATDAHLVAALNQPFPRLTYDEALAHANERRRQRNERPLIWGEDLRPRDEETVLHTMTTSIPLPTFVTHFPAKIKFFNMKLDPNESRRVLSADLLFPYSGEAVGAALREDNYRVLRDRLINSTMFRTLTERGTASLADFEPYLELVKDGAIRLHAGYGIGLDRLLQFIAGCRDIRTISVASLLGGRHK